MVQSGLIGSAIAAGILMLMYPFKGLYLADLFVDRGWVPFVLTWFLGWSAAILILKARNLSRQRAALMVDVLPVDISDEITYENLPGFLHHIESVPDNLRNSFMVSRVKRGLGHFQARSSTPEVANMMNSQSEIDLSGILGSYTLIKAFLWAIPILGFIGTVIGISSAISSFAATTQSAPDISVLMESINGVTSGLGVAFDTTLLALVVSIILYFPMASMQKAEEDLLSRIDEYCNENLLKRLNDAGGMAHVAGNMRAIAEALGANLTMNQEGVLREFQEVQRNMAEAQQGYLELFEQASQTMEQMLAATHSSAVRAMESSAEAAQRQFSNLSKSLEALNKVLANLGEHQVVIQQVRRGWFGKVKNLTPEEPNK